MNRKQILATYKRVNEEIQAMKKSIAKDIAGILEKENITQTQAAFIMNDAPSQISLVVTGKLRGFSTERLLRMRAMLGAAIEVKVTKSTKPSIKKVA